MPIRATIATPFNLVEPTTEPLGEEREMKYHPDNQIQAKSYETHWTQNSHLKQLPFQTQSRYGKS